MTMDQAKALADFLNSLHVAAPDEAPRNPFRSVPLRTRAKMVEERLSRLGTRTELVTRDIYRIWSAALEAPPADAPVWIHGDLHPCNLLLSDGALSGVVDWGDIAAGDPATDLAAFWMTVDDKELRHEAMGLYKRAGAAVRARAKGWALLFGSILLDTGLTDNPEFALIGERTFRNLAAEAASL